MNGHISKDGITRDLEAMKRSGLGGAVIFDVGIGMAEAPGPVRTFSPEW